MGDAAKKVYEAALALSPAERADLVDRLATSLEPDDVDVDYAAAWTDELRRRLADIEAGRGELLSVEAALDVVRK